MVAIRLWLVAIWLVATLLGNDRTSYRMVTQKSDMLVHRRTSMHIGDPLYLSLMERSALKTAK